MTRPRASLAHGTDRIVQIARSPLPAMALDAKGRVAAANEAFARCLACAPEQLVGTELSSWGADPAAIREFLRERPGSSREFAFRAADGSARWLALSAGADASAEDLWLSAFDLTGRHAAEEALKEENERFRGIIGVGGGTLYETNVELTQIRLLDRHETDGVVTLRERTVRFPEEVIDPSFNPEGIAETQKLYAAREPVRNFVYRVPNTQGKEIYRLGNSIPIYDKNGAYQGRRGVSIDVTAQILAEHALRESEQRFRQLADAGSDWFWEMDAELRFTYVSPNIEVMTGLRPEDLIGKRRDEIGSTAFDPERWREHSAALQEQRPFRDFVYRYRDGSGGMRWLKTSGVPIVDAAGAFRGYRGVAADITAQIEAEQKAQSRARWFYDAVGHIGQPLSIYDSDNRLIACNQAYKDVHRTADGGTVIRDGMSLRELAEWRLDTGFWRVAPGEGIDAVMEKLNNTPVRSYELSDGRSMLVDTRHMPDGTRVSLWTDVTELRRASERLTAALDRAREGEAELRRAREHLEHAQRVAATGSSERDLKTGALEWSEEMYLLAGVDRDSFTLTDANIFGLVHEEDRERLKATVLAGRAGTRPPPIEFRIRRADGALRTLYCETDVIRDKSGAPSRVLTVFKDVTELRAAEQRQTQMERQLLEVQKLEALSTLAGGVAHELNNTLVPVLALAKMTIKRLPEGSREQANILTILQAGEKARDLVQRMVAFSRKEAPTRAEVDLAELTRDSLALLRHSLPTTITLVEKVEPVPTLLGDRTQLSQVLINLVMNAVQATPAQTGTVLVEVAPAAGERLPQMPDRVAGSAVRLSVIDRGCGMDRATLARIFEPFFTTKGVGVGTGLGLAVAHGVIAQHGGRIAVESEVGSGSRFDVYLPAAANLSQAKAHPG
jgi:PAS domain S-box-containing protein